MYEKSKPYSMHVYIDPVACMCAPEKGSMHRICEAAI